MPFLLSFFAKNASSAHHNNLIDRTMLVRQDSARRKRQILAEMAFLRTVASHSESEDDNGDEIRHVVEVREMLQRSTTPIFLMKKEPLTLRGIQMGLTNIMPAEAVR